MHNPLNADIYEYMENGGSVQDDIMDMDMDEMFDYFGDQDPCAFI